MKRKENSEFDFNEYSFEILKYFDLHIREPSLNAETLYVEESYYRFMVLIL